MSRACTFAIACASLLGSLVAAESPRDGKDPADDRSLVRTLANWVQKLQGNGGQWSFVFDDVQMFLVTDQAANRMRIIAPVADATMLSHGQLVVLMEANFDRALDARYAIYDGSVWCTFVHPLKELSDAELESAIRQVAALHANYGTTFSSMDVAFGQDATSAPDPGDGDAERDVNDE